MLQNIIEELNDLDYVCQEMYRHMFLAESLALHVKGSELDILNNIALTGENALLLNISRVQSFRDYLKDSIIVFNNGLGFITRIRIKKHLDKIRTAIEDATEFLERIFKVVSGGANYAQLDKYPRTCREKFGF